MKEFNQQGDLLDKVVKAYKLSKEVSYKFGVRIPNNPQEALRLDEMSKDTLWGDSIKNELKKKYEYETFRVLEDHERMPFWIQENPLPLYF